MSEYEKLFDLLDEYPLTELLYFLKLHNITKIKDRENKSYVISLIIDNIDHQKIEEFFNKSIVYTEDKDIYKYKRLIIAYINIYFPDINEKGLFNIIDEEDLSEQKQAEIISLFKQELDIYTKNLEKLKKELESKEYKLKLDVYHKNPYKYNIFFGETNTILLCLLYITSKYKNVCIYKPDFITDIKIDITHKEQINWYCDKDNSNKDENPYIPSKIKDLLLNCDKQFVIMLLALRCNKDDHQNLFIYNKFAKTIERFEPHGTITISDMEEYNLIKLDNYFEKYFKSIIPNIKYLKPVDICPRFGFQVLELPEKSLLADSGGFCAAWSLFYIDQRLNNPDIPPKDLMNLIILQFKESKIDFRTFIRDYSNFTISQGIDMIKMAKLETSTYIPIETIVLKNMEKIMVHRKNPIKLISCSDISYSDISKKITNKNTLLFNSNYAYITMEMNYKKIDSKKIDERLDKLKNKINKSTKYKMIVVCNSINIVNNLDVFNLFDIDKYWIETDKKEDIFRYIVKYIHKFMVDKNIWLKLKVRYESSKLQEIKKNDEKSLMKVLETLNLKFKSILTPKEWIDVKSNLIKYTKKAWKSGYNNIYEMFSSYVDLYEPSTLFLEQHKYKKIKYRNIETVLEQI